MKPSKKKRRVSAYKKESILSAYANLYKKLKKSPTMDELVGSGFTKDSIRHHFSSITKLDSEARLQHADKFTDVRIEDIYTGKAIKELRKAIKSHDKFVITTAVTGCEVDSGLYGSLKNYCTRHKALLLILVASDPAHNRNKGGYGTIDKVLANEYVLLEDTELNTNLFLSTLKLSAKQVDPTTGLDRIGQREGSFIFASPKQRLNMVATSNVKLPHAVMTTGAVTKPNYRTNMYMSERTAYIADEDHVMGALIIKVENDQEYYYTQIQSRGEDGSFVHMGTRYLTNGATNKECPEALVCGDWHSGSTDPIIRLCTEEMIKALHPTRVVLHDVLDGDSINHHEELNKLTKAMRFRQGAPSLEEELEHVKGEIDWFADQVDGVIIVASNHDEFLSKQYLQKGKYVDDPQNHYISLSLAKAMIEGKDPLQWGVESLGLKNKAKVRWLQRDEDFKIAGIQLGAHGDKGSNGRQGSLQNMQKSYGNSVSGHSHTPGIVHGAFAVGTSSFLKLSYNQGPSSWLHTHCLVYKDGSRQLVNMINGKWKL